MLDVMDAMVNDQPNLPEKTAGDLTANSPFRGYDGINEIRQAGNHSPHGAGMARVGG